MRKCRRPRHPSSLLPLLPLLGTVALLLGALLPQVSPSAQTSASSPTPRWASTTPTLLRSGGGLLVEVLNASDELPVGEAIVSVAGGTDAVTPSNGTVRFYLPAGTTPVNVVALGYEASHTNTTVTAGETLPYAVTLTPLPPGTGYAVEFSVVNRSTYRPVANANISWNGVPLGVTDGQGNLTAPTRYLAGTYALEVSAVGYQTNRTEVPLTAPILLLVQLNSTYSGAPSPGTLVGSYFPWNATLTIDRVQVNGTAGSDGGAHFSVLVAAGMEYAKLTYGAETVEFTLDIASSEFNWVHLAGVNSSGQNVTKVIERSPATPLDLWITQELPFIALGTVAGVALVLGLLWWRDQAARGKRPSAEGLSRPARAGEGPEDGRAGGDPPASDGPGDPRP